AITPDGKEVWVNAGGEDHVPIVDVATLKIKDKVQLGEAIGNGHIWFSPDGKQAYLTSPKFGRVYIIDIPGRKVLANVPVGKTPTFIQVTSDGKNVWGTNTGGTDVYVIDAAATTVAATVEVGPNPNHLTILGQAVYVTVGGANEVAVIENVGGNLTVTQRIPVGKKPHGIWSSSDGKRLYVVHEESNDLKVIDLSSRAVVGSVPVGTKPIAVVVAKR
ncbi:MAG: beta-propeller fold lactonase family protein, partial [candidate division NC10 bacterium]|nr:beta-propeller fold lactonase family protein [candidate division NC10 bacterium]